MRVDLTDSGNVLTLEISDDGQGIADSDKDKDKDKRKTYGIKGLQERAKSVGGWLDVSTRAGQGTSIILSVPLSHSGSPAQPGAEE